LVPSDNIIAFEQSIIKFMLNPELKKVMSKKSLEISNNWDDEKLLAKWDAILN
jgi:hypothetical protein